MRQFRAKMPHPRGRTLTWPRPLTPTVRTPQCGRTVWETTMVILGLVYGIGFSTLMWMHWPRAQFKKYKTLDSKWYLSKALRSNDQPCLGPRIPARLQWYRDFLSEDLRIKTWELLCPAMISGHYWTRSCCILFLACAPSNTEKVTHSIDQTHGSQLCSYISPSRRQQLRALISAVFRSASR